MAASKKKKKTTTFGFRTQSPNMRPLRENERKCLRCENPFKNETRFNFMCKRCRTVEE